MRSLPYFRALFLLAVPLGNIHAADLNGYTAQYECRAGGPHCNVDVAALGKRACDQIITPSMPWSSVDWSNNTICLEAGDHTAKGTLTIPATANGTASNYKVLRYYRASDNDDDPWRQSDANRTKVTQVWVNGSYWLIHRLTLPGYRGTSKERLSSRNQADNHIFNRLLVEGTGDGSNYYGYSQDCTAGKGYNNLVVQNSVFRNLGPYAQDWEAIAVDLQCGTNLRAVNNEIYDWVSHPIQTGKNHPSPTLGGLVIENNDLYVTPALYTNGGRSAKTESTLSLKHVGTPNSPARVIHNRIWGTRNTDRTYCCTGEDGMAVTFYQTDAWTLLQNNIIFDAQKGINNVAPNVSFIGNLFYKIRRYDPGRNSVVFNWFNDATGSTPSNYEIYFNTVIGAELYTLGNLSHDYQDIRANVFIDGGSAYPFTIRATSHADYNGFYGSVPFTYNGTSTNINHTLNTRQNNAYYEKGTVMRRTTDLDQCTSENDADCFLYIALNSGTTAPSSPTYATALGDTFQDGGVTWQAIRGPYAFYRKLRTNPERYVIPYARVHSSAPEAYRAPSNYGSRPGIGTNDES